MGTRMDEIKSEIKMLPDWYSRFQYLMELSMDMEMMPDEKKIDANLIKSCQSKSWIWADWIEGRLNVLVDSEALVSRGILTLIPATMNGLTVGEVLNFKFTILQDTGLDKQIEPDRIKGVEEAVKRIKLAAISLK